MINLPNCFSVLLSVVLAYDAQPQPTASVGDSQSEKRKSQIIIIFQRFSPAKFDNYLLRFQIKNL
jgi:hypothetical protein